MNSIRKFIFLLSLTSLSMIGGDLFAQTESDNLFQLTPLSHQSAKWQRRPQVVRICTSATAP